MSGSRWRSSGSGMGDRHNIGVWQASKTHCKYGHPYNEENTRYAVRADGVHTRACRACQRDKWRRTAHQRPPTKTQRIADLTARLETAERQYVEMAALSLKYETRAQSLAAALRVIDECASENSTDMGDVYMALARIARAALAATDAAAQPEATGERE